VTAASGENEVGESVAPYANFQFSHYPRLCHLSANIQSITSYFKICPPWAGCSLFSTF